MMLSWIPFIGPVLQGLFSTASSIYATFKSTQVEQIKADTAVTIASAQMVENNSHYLSLRIMTDAALIMPVVWSILMGWDTIVALRWPWLRFHVSDYPKNVQYIPYGAFAFLFGMFGMNVWMKRK